MERKDIWCILAIGENGCWVEACFESYDNAVNFLNKYEKENKENVFRDSEKELFNVNLNISFFIEKTELIINEKEEK